MRAEVVWFAYLAVERGLLDVDTCRRLSVVAGDNADIMHFAELLLDNAITDDFDAVQAVLDEAAGQDWGVMPPKNPFTPELAKPSLRTRLPLRARHGADQPVLKPEEAIARASAPSPEPPLPETPPATAVPEAPPKRAATPPPIPVAPVAPAKSASGGDSFYDEIASLIEQIDSGMSSGKGSIGEAGDDDEDGGSIGRRSRSRGSGGSGSGSIASGASEGGAGTSGSIASSAAAPSPAATPVSGHGAPLIKGDRPPDHAVPVGGITPAWPKFETLEKATPEAQAKAMVGLLIAATKDGCSDVHVCAGARPFVRERGAIRYLGTQPLSQGLARAMIQAVLNGQQWKYFEKEQDFDLGLAFDNGMRFRANLMYHKDGLQGTFRTVGAKVPTLEELGFVDCDRIRKLLTYHNGLILVTGPLGAGKTTTLAAMVRELNEKREDHIIMMEEPIENVFPSVKCQITQRSVGPHTNSFKSALKGALRQDPDIIVIGEMRDLETIEMAISASETGHLVIGTMHTSDSSTTLNRLLDVFPPAQQQQIRAMVAESLRGIICQRLLPAKTGGVVLAHELLLRTMAVSVAIRDGKTQNLANIMETGKREGMRLMDVSLLELWRAGKISDEVALAGIRNRVLAREITSGGLGAPAPESAFGSMASTTETTKKKGFFR